MLPTSQLKGFQPRPQQSSSKEKETFQDKSRLTEFITTKEAQEKMLERILCIEEKDKHIQIPQNNWNERILSNRFAH